METKDTAVALLKEWEKAKNDSDLRRYAKLVYGHTVEEMRWSDILSMEKCEAILEDVSPRLGKIAEDAGISIIGDKFAYDPKKALWQSVDGIMYQFLDLPAREQQAIQEWLLIKNENTKSND